MKMTSLWKRFRAFCLKQIHTNQIVVLLCPLQNECLFYFEVTTDNYSKRTKTLKRDGDDYKETIETTEKQTTVRKIKRFKPANGHEESRDGSYDRDDNWGARIPQVRGNFSGARIPQTPPFNMISVAAPVTPGGLYFHGPVREHSPVNHWLYRYG